MSTCDQPTSKTNGRWTKLEHQMFLQGTHLSIFRIGAIWQKLEENLTISSN